MRKREILERKTSASILVRLKITEMIETILQLHVDRVRLAIAQQKYELHGTRFSRMRNLIVYDPFAPV